MKKRNLAALGLFLLCAGFFGCSKKEPQAQDQISTENPIEKENENMFEADVTLDALIPKEAPPLEKRAADLAKLCEDVREGLNSLSEAAQSDTAPRKGVKAAQAVEKKYKNRLDELCSMDFSTLKEDEISDLSIEVSTIITAIREAKDLLQ